MDPLAAVSFASRAIPASMIIASFLLGIEELSISLEEPFSLLPQHAITNNSIGRVATETVDWRAADFERMVQGLKGTQTDDFQ